MGVFNAQDLARSAATPILLVEDDDADALLIERCLTESGIAAERIARARTLAEALGLVAETSRCVVLDLDLPDTDGLDALAAIGERAPDIPIIVLTGRHDQPGVEALAAGAQDYLVKADITPELLGRSIRYAIERRRAALARQQLREARLTSAETARLERGLLPTPLLRSPAVDCFTYYQPGRDHAVLGGDFFDVVETEDGHVRAIIADVMGHGPDEAALGVHLRVAWRTLVLAGMPDTLILAGLNAVLEAESNGQLTFVTVCDLTIENSELLRIRVAGHPAPLLCADGKTHYLDVEVGPPLGVSSPEARMRWIDTGGWPETVVSVGRGSSLILYTDGLLDAFAGEDTIGVDELVDSVAGILHTTGRVASWIPRLVRTAPRDSVDDIALVVVTTCPPDES